MTSRLFKSRPSMRASWSACRRRSAARTTSASALLTVSFIVAVRRTSVACASSSSSMSTSRLVIAVSIYVGDLCGYTRSVVFGVHHVEVQELGRTGRQLLHLLGQRGRLGQIVVAHGVFVGRELDDGDVVVVAVSV